MEENEKSANKAAIMFKEKRKWQIALRRYVVLKQPVPAYAPYFGLDIARFREWIELQFDQGLNWENFGKAWQFDHIIPVTYFDFALEEELKLCWSFINIQVEKTGAGNAKTDKNNLLTAKSYFEDLYKVAPLSVCAQIIEKINVLEQDSIRGNQTRKAFIKEKQLYIAALHDFSEYEFEQLNGGTTLENVQKEKEMLLKFGK